MSEQNSSTWRRLVKHWADLGLEVRQAARLRWRLAAAELRADAALLRRAALLAAVALIVAAASLPLLPVAAAELLDGQFGWNRVVWLLVLSGTGAVAAIVLAVWTWIRTRRALVALRQTREELAEDLVWLGEWLGRGDTADDDANASANEHDADDANNTSDEERDVPNEQANSKAEAIAAVSRKAEPATPARAVRKHRGGRAGD